MDTPGRTKPLLSVVSPAYNEEAVLPAFNEELVRVLSGMEDEFDFEIIYVDDGSSDCTPAILTRLALADPRVNFLRLSRNFGHQAALTAGLEYARGDVVISMDSDLQHPPSLIPQLIAGWKAGNDIVVTIREYHRSISLFKRMTSKVFSFAMRYCSGMEIRPSASDFRLLSRKALDALIRMPERLRFLRGMVHWLGFSSAEVEFVAPPRFAGESKFTLVRMIRLARDGLLSFSRIPLHAALLFAGAMLLLSFITTTAAWLAFRPEDSVAWLLLALIAGAHLAGGATWISLLAFSEYLARIHEQVLQRPLYVICDSSDELRARGANQQTQADRDPQREAA
jgi:dolichol-phosphate mannosyltransferase